MNAKEKRIILLCVGFLFLFLSNGCFYSYSALRRGIIVEYDQNIDSDKKANLFLQFTGAKIDILYRSKKQIPDQDVEWLAKEAFSKEGFKDSLKEQGTIFKIYGKGSGWTQKPDAKCLRSENENVARVDSLRNIFVDDTLYNESKINLTIIENGSTKINLNCKNDALGIYVKAKDDKIEAIGDKKEISKHNKVFFKYLFAH